MHQLAHISHSIGRQVGLLVDRKGKVEYVIVGSKKGIFIPNVSHYRRGKSRFIGLRYIHTHLFGEKIDKEDLVDLSLIQLDALVAIIVDKTGNVIKYQWAHLLPTKGNNSRWYTSTVLPVSDSPVDFSDFILELEQEFEKSIRRTRGKTRKDTALLIDILKPGENWDESLEELQQLAISSGVKVVGTAVQKVKNPNPRLLVGKGKLKEIIMTAMDLDVEILIFNQNLTPAQVRTITDITELKVIDRTQLILDIFAQKAHTKEAQIQVELAQLKYLLPRLATKNTAMSRLTGGIGGRGPGETKLEINRRRVRDRIYRLGKLLKQSKHGREQRRAERRKAEIPIISIVGYTNVGKSTLLNALTKSHVFVEDKLFATLDTASRRLRFPRNREAIVTDTVGFIRDLPPDLLNAFMSTLDELKDAHLLLHLVDLSNSSFEDHIKSVERILKNIGVDNIPTLLVFNKIDLCNTTMIKNVCNLYNAIAISAIQKNTLLPLVSEIENCIFTEKKEKIHAVDCKQWRHHWN